MSKNYKLRLIKTRESYTSKRISQELNVHQRTVQEWFKTGLKPIENKKPYLVMGYELKNFLEQKQENKKCKLKPDEFYCTKCREGVKSKGNDVQLEISTHTIGKNHHYWCFIFDSFGSSSFLCQPIKKRILLSIISFKCIC